MKNMAKLLVSAAFLMGFLGQAWAGTYTVQSAQYSTGSGDIEGAFTGTMQLSGQFTLDDSLPPNLPPLTDITAYVVSYSFNNGVDTFNDANSVIAEAEATTDAEGNVTDVNFGIGPVGPLAPNQPVSGMFFEVGIGEIFGANQAPCTAIDDGECVDVDRDLAAGWLEVFSVTISLTDITPPAPELGDATAVPTMSLYGLLATVMGLMVLAGRRLKASRDR